MPVMLKLLLAVQVVSALAIIALVLFQQGKGAEMGSAFGSGSAGSLFGATGAANFLSRATKWAAIIFFASTIGLAYVSHQGRVGGAFNSGVMQHFPDNRSVPKVPGAAPTPDGQSAAPAVTAPPAKPVGKPDSLAPATDAGQSIPIMPAQPLR
jgi:preprotein translocase subunit SecG